MSGLGQKVASGAVWVTMEKFATQIVGFVGGMVLARLLTPQDYGTVALLSIFVALPVLKTRIPFATKLLEVIS